jgi:hypothetical protein
MKTIPLLVKALQESNTLPYQLFRQYKGTDWKNYVTYLYGGKHCYPNVLLKHNNIELVIMGWNVQQTYYTYTNYNTIYSTILEGSLFCTETDEHNIKSLWYLPQHTVYSSKPFSVIDMKANRQTASLHLFHYCYQK